MFSILVHIQDVLYNKKNRSGFLFNKFHNENKKNRPAVTSSSYLDLASTLTEEEKIKLLNDSKRIIVPNESSHAIDGLKMKLLETVNVRRNLMANDPSKYLDACDSYFASSKMVFHLLTLSIYLKV